MTTGSKVSSESSKVYDKALSKLAYRNVLPEKQAAISKHRENSLGRSIKPKSMSSKKAMWSDEYTKREKSLSYNFVKTKGNKENSTATSMQSFKKSASSLSQNHGFSVKTMSALSSKKYGGTKDILGSIEKIPRKISNYCLNSEQGKLRRYTPMEQSNCEGLKFRHQREVYSSSKQNNFTMESTFDLIPDFQDDCKEPSGGYADHTLSINILDLDSNIDVYEKRKESFSENLAPKEFDFNAKMNKPTEEESVWYEETININDVTSQSIDPIENSQRRIRKDSFVENSGFKGATGRKNATQKDWEKRPSENRLVKGIKRFFQKSTYLWGCKDDFDFNWWEKAVKWIEIAEEKPLHLVDKEFFETQYRILLGEVHLKTTPNSSFSVSYEERADIERRRETIEKNKLQIIKDLDRTFINSKAFGTDSEGRKQLMDVLEVVSLKYTAIGYVQGMNFFVAGILYHSSPAVALGIMSHWIENLQLWDVYAENLVGVHYHNERLTSLVEKHLPDLFSHLQMHDVNLEIFFTQWIIDLFSHIISFEDYWLFLDNFLIHKWNFFYRLILIILSEMKPEILQMDDWSEILEDVKDRITKVNWKHWISQTNYKFLNL